ncbi:(3R)-3-hydroxyacyl-CoA dehydrogenase-like [Ixodes scapularis]
MSQEVQPSRQKSSLRLQLLQNVRLVGSHVVLGTFLVTKEAVKHMLSRNVTGAAIVNIASILGKGGFPGIGAYTASKGGVIAFTKSVALELATRGIRVNAILPGLTNTPMIQKYSDKDITRRLAAMIPMKRIAEPIEISETILFMCSPKTSYMTGASIDKEPGTTGMQRARPSSPRPVIGLSLPSFPNVTKKFSPAQLLALRTKRPFGASLLW